MNRKILYVDDDVDSRMIVSDYLRHLGHNILTVEKAADALRVADENQIDATVLDVNLRGVDGPELLGLLRREHPGMPVILYSGMNPQAEKVKHMLADGAAGFLSKNEPLEALIKALHNLWN